jgi:Flp pilus assembly protein TadG
MITACWKNTQGLIAVEFALLAPVLVVMLLGLGDYVLGFSALIQLRNAVEAGASYCLHNGAGSCTPSVVAGIASAATGLAVPTGRVSLSLSYGCATASGVTLQASSAVNCSGGYAPGQYATVGGGYDYVTTLGGVTIPLSAITIIRIQ